MARTMEAQTVTTEFVEVELGASLLTPAEEESLLELESRTAADEQQ